MARSPNRPKDIFLEALELSSPDQRVAFLAQACGGDEALLRQVEAMLQAHATPDSFLEKPAAALGFTVDAPNPGKQEFSEETGMRVGSYKLLQKIGEGGMGVVYMAEQQEPVRRLVALKIIKPGLDSAQVLARFEAELQALALMDHPNIARVFEVGTTPSPLSPLGRGVGGEGNRPYFVMELVKGVPITRYCDERRLTPRQRLELFIPVCLAVQHAHQKGIIHRDLKPSNVLIALYDGQPVPKVIDFGIAKAMGQQLTERTLFTGFGAIVGTLEYMSPEQAELNQIDIDTRSDIYSLGVLLYELLTGSTPLDRKRLKEGALLELLRLIREEEPPKPSTRLSTSEAAATLGEQRQTEPVRLAKLVRGDIDWIVMKALDKDRNRRYVTAAEMGQDIRRFLSDEPVQAGPPSAFYRTRKFVKRNRGAVLAAALLLLALLGGVVGTTLGMWRARDAEAAARDALEAAEANRRLAQTALLQATAALDDAEKSEKQANQEKSKAERSAREALAAQQRAENNEKSARFQTLRTETAHHAIQIDQAYRTWQRHDIVETERLLANIAKPFQQSWETRYLRELCRRSLIPIGGSRERPTPVAISADGQRVVLADDKNIVKVLNPATGEELLSLPGHTGAILYLVSSSDGKVIVSGSADKTAKVWNAEGKLLFTFPLHLGVFPDYWVAVAISADGKQVVTISDDNTFKLWDAQTGKENRAFKSEGRTLTCVAVSGDGKQIAAMASNCVGVWDAETGKSLMASWKWEREWESISMGSQGPLIALSPDGQRGVTSSAFRFTARVFDMATGKVLFHLPPPPGYPYRGAIGSLAFSGDGKRIVTGDENGVVHVWDAGSGQHLFALTGGDRHVRNLAVSGNGRRVVISHGWGRKQYDQAWVKPEERLVKLWDEGIKPEILSRTPPLYWPNRTWYFDAAFNADGTRVLELNDGKTVNVWDVKTGQELPGTGPRPEAAGRFGRDTVTSPDGLRIFSSFSSTTVVVRDPATYQEVLRIPVLDNPDSQFPSLFSLAISPDSRRLVVGIGELQDAKTPLFKVFESP